MRKYTWLILFSFFSFQTLFAQVNGDVLEKYSRDISKLQLAAEPVPYYDYKITFPEENFTVNAASKLATVMFYTKQESGDELLKTIDNIDLAKATSIVYSGFGYSVKQYYVTITFPDNYLQVKTEKNGKVMPVKKEKELLIYYKGWNWYDRADLFRKLSELILMLKVDKQLISQESVDRMNRAWKIALIENTPDSYKAFYKSYPTALYSKQAQDRFEYGVSNALYYDEARLAFNSVGEFGEDMQVVNFYGKYGFIEHKSSKLILPAKYDEANAFKNGKARVKQDGRVFYIDKKGNEVAVQEEPIVKETPAPKENTVIKEDIPVAPTQKPLVDVKSWSFVRNIIGSSYSDVQKALIANGFRLDNTEKFDEGNSYYYSNPDITYTHIVLGDIKEEYTVVVKNGKVRGVLLEFMVPKGESSFSMLRNWEPFEKGFLGDNFKKVNENNETFKIERNYRNSSLRTKMRISIYQGANIYNAVEVILSDEDLDLDK
ncbi:MAG TPA: WG repeat-containing protein [Ferruginibacter sp.]|nr:WG repeat-containing protein [Ferruginibacter sp.]